MDSEDIWGDELEPACMTLGFPFRQAEGIRWLRISPVGAVKEEAKHRKVHDMTFAGSNEKGGSRSVNTTTGWSKIPQCELSEVMKDVIKRILGLRAKFDTNKRIIIQTMDVKSAFR